MLPGVIVYALVVVYILVVVEYYVVCILCFLIRFTCSSREFLDVALLAPEVMLFKKLVGEEIMVHIFRRCVDDIILRVRDARQLPRLLTMMAEVYPSTMTFNVQVSFKIARFLDFNIHKQKIHGSVKAGLQVFSMKYKETSSFVYSMPGSNIPDSYLHAAIVSHVWRTYRRNDQQLDVYRDLKVMKKIFRKRGFKAEELEKIRLRFEAAKSYQRYLEFIARTGRKSGPSCSMRYGRCRTALLQLALLEGEDDGRDYARRWLKHYKRKAEGREKPQQYLSVTYDRGLGLHDLITNVVHNVFGSSVLVALRTFRNRLNMISPKRVVNQRLSEYMEQKNG